MGTDQAIDDLRARPGELSFRARVGGLDKRLFIRTATDLTPNADAALAGCLMPAMASGGTLTMSDPVSPRLLRTQREFGAIQQAWSQAWEFGAPPLRETEVLAPVREVEPRPPTGRVAAFFSGGVDSWATVLDNPDVTDLIFVRGIDLLPGAVHQAGLADQVEARLRGAAGALGLQLHAVETNLRDLSDPLVRWEAYYGCAVVAVALFLAPLFDRVMIAGDSDYEVQVPLGANRLVDQLWSTEDLEIVDEGGRFSRMERVRRIGSHPVVQQTLRVCWENPGGAYNCGQCRKCLMTMAALEAAGLRKGIATFPAELDLEAFDRMAISQPVVLLLWEDVLDAAGAGADPELERALRKAVTKARRELGFAADSRRRPRRTAPPPVAAAGQEILDLRRGPGEISFEARIGGRAKQLFIRTATDLTPNADAALAGCLMPAMASGGTLTMSDPVSPRLLRTQREFGAIQSAWSHGWPAHYPRLHEVEVRAPTRELESRQPTGRVAAFFSGGVDSWATVLDNPDVTDLIFVRGIDLLPGAVHQAELADEVEARLREAAELLGLRLHAVETNLRELGDPLVPWEAYFACPLAAVALFFEPLFDRVLIAGDTDYGTQAQIGSAWTIDSLWSTESLEIVDAGGRFTREQRLRRIATHPVVQRTLRVCWQNPGGAYNCGHCRKCLITMLSLEAIGARESFPTFPPGLDLDLLRGFEMSQTIQLVLWEDLLRTTRDAGRQDLAGPIEEFVARGRNALGLSPTHRHRHRPVAAVRATPGTVPPPNLFATPATAAALASARSAAFLVGSYDGSGNFGDIAQLDAALALLAPFEPGLLVMPVIERACEQGHRQAATEMRNPPENVLFFGADEGEDGLVAVTPPSGLSYAACYLYGGGYLNRSWGDRKLMMLGAVEAIAIAGGAARVDRISSGLQVDPDWLAGLAATDQRTLRGFALHGARDRESSEALALLAPSAGVIESGDDAVGLLPAVAAAGPEPPAGRFRVNVHFAEHEWVSDDPDAMLRFHASFLAALDRLASRPLLVQPLLTYVDSRTDERPGLDRLAAACAELGVELREPLLLRPAGLDSSAGEIALAELTLSCSYHAALASLTLAVPAILVADNPYYAQKAAGLQRDFRLPPELAARSGEDPGAVAARALAAIEGEPGQALRQRLTVGAADVAGRRARAEAAIASRLGAGAIAVLGGDHGGPGVARELAAAEQRAVDAQRQLGEIASSRSWRLTAPLRGAGAALRGRLRR